MRLIDLACPHCGAKITPRFEPSKGDLLACEYCGTTFLLDDESQGIDVRFDAEKAGYEFEKGRQRAVREGEFHKDQARIKKRKRKPIPSTGLSSYRAYSAPARKRHGFWYWFFLWPVYLCFLPLLIPYWILKKMLER